MHHGDVSPEIAQGLLALKMRIATAKVPPSQLDETIHVAVWKRFQSCASNNRRRLDEPPSGN